jgi:hypothetical protein
VADKLIELSKAQTDPGSVSGKDFKVKVPAEGKGGNDDSLIDLSHNQCSPRSTEDGHTDGKTYGSPVPEDRSKIIARNFPVSVNKGEASDKPGSVSGVRSINLKTGQLEPDAAKK